MLPVLSYGSVIWSPSSKQDERLLETPQHRLIRYLSLKIKQPMHRFYHDYGPLSKLLGINTIKSVHTYQDYIFVFKVFNGLINSEDVINLFSHRPNLFNLRTHNVFWEDKYGNNFDYNAIVPRLRRLWNRLLPQMASLAGLSSFKSSVSIFTAATY